MGVSRVTVTIDRIVLRGFEARERNALVEGLEREFTQVLGDSAARAEWVRSHRTPVVKLGQMPLEPGPSGAKKFGGAIVLGIGRSLKP